jgi:NADH-quinone oxidoreductase subunit K
MMLQSAWAQWIVPLLAQAAGATQNTVDLSHYLVVSALSFGIGLMIVITRRNAIAVLMGIELMLNSAGLNFVAFSKFTRADGVEGQVVTLFVIVIAAAEAAVAIALVLNIYNNLNTVEVTEAHSLKG